MIRKHTHYIFILSILLVLAGNGNFEFMFPAMDSCVAKTLHAEPTSTCCCDGQRNTNKAGKDCCENDQSSKHQSNSGNQYKEQTGLCACHLSPPPSVPAVSNPSVRTVEHKPTYRPISKIHTTFAQTIPSVSNQPLIHHTPVNPINHSTLSVGNVCLRI